MNIPIVYEDETLIVIDKPPGVIVNRAASVTGKTVQDWAEERLDLVRSRHSVDSAEFFSRAGIVHRIDKETSGLLIIAKTPTVFSAIQEQFKARLIKKTYVAIVHGQLTPDNGEIAAPIGRLPWNRERFGIVPEGKAAVKKMFDAGDPVRMRRYIAGISPVTAVNIKDILIPYLLRLDAGASFNDAYNVALLLANAKDEGVLQKILDLGLKKKDAHALLVKYGAMGAEAVIQRALKDEGTFDMYKSMLAECKLDEAVEPIRGAAETSENARVAWLCGDALYYRQKPVPIALDRAKAWLAATDPAGQSSGIRQMALQKESDRDAALLPFTKVEAAKEVRLTVLEVASRDKTLSRELIRNLLNIQDYEFFQDVAVGVEQARLFEYIEDLARISDDGDRDGATRRLAGSKSQSLKSARGDK